MKTIVSILLLVFITGTAKAQHLKESAVPAAVVKNFHDAFKDASVKSWEKEKNGTYEVEFNWNKKENTVIFDAQGNQLWTKEKVAASELPKTVADYISKNYPDYKVSEVELSIAPSGDANYEVEINKGKDEQELLFDSNGTFVKRD